MRDSGAVLGGDWLRFFIFVGFWLLCGGIGVFMAIVFELRGEKYNVNFLNEETVVLFLLLLMGGLVTMLIVLIKYIVRFLAYNESITKLLYKIANIGLKEKEEKNGITAD